MTDARPLDIEALRETLDGVPHLEQYRGVWLIHEAGLLRALADLNGVDLIAHVREQRAAYESRVRSRQERTNGRSFRLTHDGIAVVELAGFMTKFGSSFSRLEDGTIGVRRAIRQAITDDEVRAIMLFIDSPGGNVQGTGDLANDVFTAAAHKPLMAFIEDTGASAAFWVASQAGTLIANSTAVVGSIGTFAVIRDFSELLQREGVKTHVVSSAPLKGVGARGAEVSGEALDDMQRVVGELQDQFNAGVARGRGISLKEVRTLADGRVHIGINAQKIGLVDAIATFDAAMERLRSQIGTPNVRPATRPTERSARKERSMSNDVETASNESVKEKEGVTPTKVASNPVPDGPATYDQLKSACAGASPEFLCSQLEGRATVDQARTAFMAAQQKRVENAEAEATELRDKADAAKTKPGVEPVGTGGGKASSDSGADPIEAFSEAVEEKVRGGMRRDKAHAAVARKQPELRAAYVAAFNEQHGRTVAA